MTELNAAMLRLYVECNVKRWIVGGEGFVLLKKIMVTGEAVFAGEGACGPQTILKTSTIMVKTINQTWKIGRFILKMTVQNQFVRGHLFVKMYDLHTRGST
jgi:hypothetical protein